MNVQDVSDIIRRTFGDDGAVQIADADILRWINAAQLQISIDNEELLETVGTADIVIGQADYTTPPDMNVLRSCMYNNFRLRGLSFAQFNEYLDGFKATTAQGGYGNATPEVFMVYGGTITLFPTPNQNITAGLRIYYSKHPAAVSNLADELGVPQRYHNSVVEYCLKMAYEMDENLDAAAYKKSEYSSQVQKLKDQEKWTSTEFYPTITTSPQDESYFDAGGWYG